MESSPVHVEESLPLSLLNDYLYCERRAALKVVEGWRSANEHTNRGDIVHENADLPGYEVAKGATLLRALPVWSERLGLNGKCDIVEQRSASSLFPVEYKRGKKKQWVNDDVQLCAQAICLEEMFHISIPQGAIFHAESKRRREVVFTAELREMTERTAQKLHELQNASQLPLAVFKPACEECSLYEICLPNATSGSSRAMRLNLELFKT